jgi:hypothetical protein
VKLIEPATAYASGERARLRGHARLSPYYENHFADFWFFAGYDRIPKEKAAQLFGKISSALMDSAAQTHA